jgi:hypothetical protein
VKEHKRRHPPVELAIEVLGPKWDIRSGAAVTSHTFSDTTHIDLIVVCLSHMEHLYGIGLHIVTIP